MISIILPGYSLFPIDSTTNKQQDTSLCCRSFSVDLFVRSITRYSASDWIINGDQFGVGHHGIINRLDVSSLINLIHVNLKPSIPKAPWCFCHEIYFGNYLFKFDANKSIIGFIENHFKTRLRTWGSSFHSVFLLKFLTT